ncbi:MAG: hypothetical protein DRP22_04905 [Verrucomicrobia bacterium]|nr:MAG: hypothetical protein DRP22_04905 [Verrucomicrobiota bacterium]
MLRAAIVHYHLRPGGVTRIIRETLSGLAEHPVRVAVLVGDVPDDATNLPELVAVIPELNYSEAPPHGQEYRRIARRLLEDARALLGATPDVVHVHNHTLAKSSCLPGIVRELAAAGQRLLLHIHDFAEDGRPADYRRIADTIAGGDLGRLAQMMYPAAPQIHYAVLNRRDYGFLKDAGVPEANLHYLPNPVRPLPASEARRETETPLVLYPTRAIRRKNLGEFLLWAAVTDGAQFATTLEPTNPTALLFYRRWKALSQRLGLPVRFGVGSASEHRLADLFASAECVITTSVAEGFGLAFIEPWTVGRPLVGRDIPEITSEFREAGLKLDALYPRLPVPLEWVGERRLRRRLRRSLTSYYRSYGRDDPDLDVLEAAWRAAVADGMVDFGRLDEDLQARVVRIVTGNRAARRSLGVPHPLESVPGADIVEHNRRVTVHHFSLETYARRLSEIYEHVASSSVGSVGAHDAARVLSAFLRPERFFMIRT